MGTIQGKADYLNDLKPDPAIKQFAIREFESRTQRRYRATLDGLARLDVEVDGEVRETGTALSLI